MHFCQVESILFYISDDFGIIFIELFNFYYKFVFVA